ncbi:unnamed protein product [Spirodela intermedia]|uniref:Fucosyltransferase n=1 Tax=Spirodela intermedia TaxID=51605 RepID=A0A7I8IA28_SPIIN|nr:unnamed protein product [Spirodela intermedia]CAA6653902.1 unnamed protein product [Spirodela intermedia]
MRPPHRVLQQGTATPETGGAAREAAETGCRYLVWTPTYGLGNRILSLASTFLYALLTDRVLLIDRGNDFSSLMCEPFPNTTWLLPLDFPVKNFNSFNQGHPLSYGRLVKKQDSQKRRFRQS